MTPQVMKKLKERDIVAVRPGGIVTESDSEDETLEMPGGVDRHLEDHWLAWVVERHRSIKSSDDEMVHGTELDEGDDCLVIQWLEHVR